MNPDLVIAIVCMITLLCSGLLLVWAILSQPHKSKAIYKRERIPLEVLRPNPGSRSYLTIYKMHNYPIPLPFQLEVVTPGLSTVHYASTLREALEKAADILDDLELLENEPAQP